MLHQLKTIQIYIERILYNSHTGPDFMYLYVIHTMHHMLQFCDNVSTHTSNMCHTCGCTCIHLHVHVLSMPVTHQLSLCEVVDSLAYTGNVWNVTLIYSHSVMFFQFHVLDLSLKLQLEFGAYN